MSQPLWRTVLENSAKQFRARPAIWVKRDYGNALNLIMQNEPERLARSLDAGRVTACLNTMIRAQSLIAVGKDSHNDVAGRAIAEICKHHGLPQDTDGIIEFNDGPACNSADDVVAFIDGFLAKRIPAASTETRVLEDA